MFRELSRLPVSAVIFAAFSMLCSALAILIENHLERIDFMLFSLVFLNLFTYSVLSERIKRCEK